MGHVLFSPRSLTGGYVGEEGFMVGRVRRLVHVTLIVVAAALPSRPGRTFGESGYDAWLRYAPLEGQHAEQVRAALPAVIVTMGESPNLESATSELIRGVRGRTGRVLRVAKELPDEPAIVVGTVVDTGFVRGPARDDARTPDGYHVFFRERDGHQRLFVVGTNYRSALYAAFTLLRHLATNQPLEGLDLRSFE